MLMKFSFDKLMNALRIHFIFKESLNFLGTAFIYDKEVLNVELEF